MLHSLPSHDWQTYLGLLICFFLFFGALFFLALGLARIFAAIQEKEKS